MAYTEWGDPANPRVLVCVHGLSRQGRDFDTLARDLSRDYRVVCPDVVGRGESDWLADPMGYNIPAYITDMVTLIARLNVSQVDWVGTSMGGLIGLGLASLLTAKAPQMSLVRRLVINDIGPTIDPAGMARIGSYLGRPSRWASVEDAASAMWQISQSFGAHSPDEWLGLSRPQLKPDEQGGFVPRCDPAIVAPIAAMTPEIAAAGEAMMWQSYDRVTAPTLLLRGADSDLLSRATAQSMTERGPKARLHEFAGVGHAPTLVHADQRRVVREFLLASA